MDQLLILPLKHGVQENLLASLRQAGWRITVTADMVRAKQLLQKREVAALILEINPAGVRILGRRFARLLPRPVLPGRKRGQAHRSTFYKRGVPPRVGQKAAGRFHMALSATISTSLVGKVRIASLPLRCTPKRIPKLVNVTLKKVLRIKTVEYSLVIANL